MTKQIILKHVFFKKIMSPKKKIKIKTIIVFHSEYTINLGKSEFENCWKTPIPISWISNNGIINNFKSTDYHDTNKAFAKSKEVICCLPPLDINLYTFNNKQRPFKKQLEYYHSNLPIVQFKIDYLIAYVTIDRKKISAIISTDWSGSRFKFR